MGIMIGTLIERPLKGFVQPGVYIRLHGLALGLRGLLGLGFRVLQGVMEGK